MLQAQLRIRHRPIVNLPLLFPGLRELLVSYLIQIAVQIQRQMWQQQQQKCLWLFQKFSVLVSCIYFKFNT